MKDRKLDFGDLAYPEVIDATEDIDKPEEPKMWKVILHNDDYTPMNFVVMIIMKVFHKLHMEAERMMMQIHKSNKAIIGIFTKEIAESKVTRITEIAELNEFPLKITMEIDE